MTTIRDLYEWAVKNNAETLPVGIQFQDEGGTYSGDTFTSYSQSPNYEVFASVEKSGDDKYVLLA